MYMARSNFKEKGIVTCFEAAVVTTIASLGHQHEDFLRVSYSWCLYIHPITDLLCYEKQ